MRKIAFITPSYYPAILTGSGIVVLNLAEQFVKEGYDVSIITSNALTPRYWYDPLFGKKITKAYETYHGVKIYRLLCNQWYSSICFVLVKIFDKFIPAALLNKLAIESAGPYLMGLEAFVKSERYDVIHCSPSPLAINMQTVRMIKRLKRKPKLIITPFFHSEIGEFANPELKKIFDAATIVHAITGDEKETLQSRFGVPEKKIKVVSLFLDLEGMHTAMQLQNDVSRFKKKHNLEKKKIVLFAGIKGYAKGAVSLLLAIDQLHKKHSEYILVAVGTDTPEWNQAKKRIDPQCLVDLSYTIGKEKEVLFASCDIFCMPSKSESFGLVYLEAWHKKKPVIAASTAAVREFLGKNGIYVEFSNAQQIEKAIKVLGEDKNTQKKIGENGYNTLMKTYIFKNVFPKYKQLFVR